MDDRSWKNIVPIPRPEIAAKAQELTAGAPDLYTKLSRITGYIQKNIRYFIVDARHRRLAGPLRRRYLSQPLRRLQRQDHPPDLHAPGRRHPRPLLCTWTQRRGIIDPAAPSRSAIT